MRKGGYIRRLLVSPPSPILVCAAVASQVGPCVSLGLPPSPSAVRPKSVEIGNFFAVAAFPRVQVRRGWRNTPPPIDATCKMRTLKLCTQFLFFFFELHAALLTFHW